MVNDITDSRPTERLLEFQQSSVISNLEKSLNSTDLWRFIKRAINKVKRILKRIAWVKSGVDWFYASRANRYRKTLSKLDEEDQLILETLQKTGTISIPIEDLELQSTEPFLQKTMELASQLKHTPSEGKLFMDIEKRKFRDCPEIFLWGIEQRLFNIVEHYIGLPIYYLGYAIRRDIVNQDPGSGTLRSWHLDVEDRTVIKIIIYLNDVGVDGGHYEYISKDLAREAAKKLKYDTGFVDDQTMMNVVPQNEWSNCMGKKGTVIISATSDVFHRAKPPEKDDRFSISFCYTSNKPTYHWNAEDFYPSNLSELSEQLNQKQRDALINRNKFLGIRI